LPETAIVDNEHSIFDRSAAVTRDESCIFKYGNSGLLRQQRQRKKRKCKQQQSCTGEQCEMRVMLSDRSTHGCLLIFPRIIAAASGRRNLVTLPAV
jgi:hypothetical protein